MDFEIGDIFYHKASLKRGVLTCVNNDVLGIVWEDHRYRKHIVKELYGEKDGIVKIQQLSVCLSEKHNSVGRPSVVTSFMACDNRHESMNDKPGSGEW